MSQYELYYIILENVGDLPEKRVNLKGDISFSSFSLFTLKTLQMKTLHQKLRNRREITSQSFFILLTYNYTYTLTHPQPPPLGLPLL